MYAISSVNVSKYKSLSEGMQSAFNKKDYHKAVVSTDNQNDGPSAVEKKPTTGTYGDGLEELHESLSDFENGESGVKKRDGRIDVDIKAGSLFKVGTADLTADALIHLMKLANKIKDKPFPVAIEGYTDNVPIETPEFKSNWELSAARAAAIGRVLNAFGVDSERILVIGYGEQFPLMDNATEAGRSRNRRVNIVITKTPIVKRIVHTQ